MTGIVERLHIDAACLRKMVDHAKLAGPETDVRVKSPGLLLESLSEAAAEIANQRALIENMVAAFRDLSELTESGDDPISYVREIANEALAAAKSEGFDQ